MTNGTEGNKLQPIGLGTHETSVQPKCPRMVSQGAADLAHVLDAFTLIPFHTVAEGMGRSVRALFKEATGQDAARLSRAKVREKTLQAVEERLQSWMERSFKDSPDELERFREYMATTPHTRSGAQAAWATWVHQQEQPPALRLPTCKTVGLVIDELVETLKRHCLADNLPAYRRTWLDHFKHHGLLIRTDSQVAAMPVAADDPCWGKLKGMKTWETANKLTRVLLEGLYFDLVSALDMEWGAWYFGVMQPMPLFPLVMVEVKEGLLKGEKQRSRKNLIRQPQRRLLEFMYAIMEYRFRGKWHEKEPLPGVVAKSLELVSVDVSNYFDGTRRLTYKKVDNYWRQLIKHFSDRTAVPAEMPAPPMPMVALALHWQTLLVLDKGKEKSFILIDLDSYNERWRLRRQRWESQNIGMTERPAGHPTKKLGEWPAWMLNQSSSAS